MVRVGVLFGENSFLPHLLSRNGEEVYRHTLLLRLADTPFFRWLRPLGPLTPVVDRRTGTCDREVLCRDWGCGVGREQMWVVAPELGRRGGGERGVGGYKGRCLGEVLTLEEQ